MERVTNRFKKNMIFESAFIYDSSRFRGLNLVRKFLTMHTKKYKLKIKVMQFYYRLGNIQNKIRANR